MRAMPEETTGSFETGLTSTDVVTLTRHVSLRAIQVDYLYTHFGGAGQNNLRIQSGLVWRFGR